METTYRDGLELNTTYLVGKTLEGETMLLPKQLMEQANVITIDENNTIENDQIDFEPIDENHLYLTDEQPPEILEEKQSDLSDEGQINYKQTPLQDILKTSYISQGNVVRCVTGSFD